MRSPSIRAAVPTATLPFVVAFAVVAVACQDKGATPASDSASKPVATISASAADTAGCGFVAKNANTDPDSLLNEFFRRDGDGEFAQTSAWRDEAMACPAHAPGWDGFTLVSSVMSQPLNKTADTVSYIVTYQRIGLLEQDSASYFVKPDAGVETDTLIIGHSAFGWRIVDWDHEPHLMPAGAIKLPKLREADRKKLAQEIRK